MKKILLVLMTLFMLIGCSSKPKELTTYENAKISGLSMADLSGYKQMDPSSNWVKTGSMKLINELLDANDSFIAFFGYTGCTYCQDLLPVLNAVVTDYKVPVVYDDVTKDDFGGDEYNKIITRLDAFLKENEEGKKELYVPFVIIVKNGKVVYTHLGTISSHDAHQRPLNEDETKKIKADLISGIEMLLEK